MGLLLERRALKISGGKLANPPTWLREFFGGLGGTTVSGVRVDEETAMRFIAVFACVRILAETMGQVPLIVYRRLQPRGKERATDHRLYRLLHDEPNPEITSCQWRETITAHQALWGNCYHEIESDETGQPVALWPITPKRVRIERARLTQRRLYHVSLPEGGETILFPEQMLHVPLLSLNGLTGLSPIGVAREAVGLGLAAEEYASRFFAGDTNVGGVLQHPGSLSDRAYERLLAHWQERHGGLSKAHRLAILEEGLKFERVGIPPEDAQFIEQRRFSVNEIARLYRIPPHLLSDVERSTSWGSGIEQQSIGYVVYTITPYAVRFEQAFNKLIAREERATIFIEFLLDSLARGDLKSRYEAYAVGRQWGWLSADDCREKENMNELPDGRGSTYLIPLNMVPAPPIDADGRASERWTDELRAYLGARNGSRPMETRSAAGRRRLAGAFRRIFEDVGARVVRRERADVMRAAEEMLRQQARADFELFLTDFYRGEMQDFVRHQFAPAFGTYAEAVLADVSDEINPGRQLEPEMEEFLAGYILAFGGRWAGSSRGQLLSVLAAAFERDDDPVEALSERFDEWAEKRPGKVAAWETQRLGNATALEAFRSAGVQRKVWQATGRSCPYCQSLDGRTVSVQEIFLDGGTPLQPEGAETPLVTETIRHPPLHAGCDCIVVAG